MVHCSQRSGGDIRMGALAQIVALKYGEPHHIYYVIFMYELLVV